MNIKLEGFNQLISKFNKNTSQIDNVCQDAILDCGNDLEKKAIQLTPLDTGALRGSAYVQAKSDGVEVGFDEEYAIFVHEDLNAHHPVGQAKFLEQPLQENTKEYTEYVSKKVNDLIKR